MIVVCRAIRTNWHSVIKQWVERTDVMYMYVLTIPRGILRDKYVTHEIYIFWLNIRVWAMRARRCLNAQAPRVYTVYSNIIIKSFWCRKYF